MRCSASIVTVLFFAVPCARASAQPWQDEGTFGPKESQFLVNFSGSYTYDSNPALTSETLGINLGLGYFISREHEIGADLFMQYQKVALDIGGGTRTDSYAVLPYYNYNYYLSPRLSVHGGPHLEFFSLNAGDGRDNDYGYGVQIGARYWVTPSVSLSVEPRYTHRKLSSGSIDKEDEFQTLFGLNFVL
jgi:opacity protein-like surface antigen